MASKILKLFACSAGSPEVFNTDVRRIFVSDWVDSTFITFLGWMVWRIIGRRTRDWVEVEMGGISGNKNNKNSGLKIYTL